MSVNTKNTLIAFLSAIGVVLAASYMLLLYENVFLGPLNKNIDKKINGLNLNELFTFIVLSIIIILLGIKPNLILSYTSVSLDRIVDLYPITIF